MVGDSVVQDRLQFLRNETRYLKSERDQTSFQAYAANMRLRKAVERSLQLAIESCIDVGRRLIAVNGYRDPQNYQDVFAVLAEENIIPAKLLSTLQDMSRFRNLLVHDYARIDDAVVFDILSSHLADFEAFADAIRASL